MAFSSSENGSDDPLNIFRILLPKGQEEVCESLLMLLEIELDVSTRGSLRRPWVELVGVVK